MNLLKHIPFKTSLLFIVMLIVLDTSYYFHFKEQLIINQKEKIILLFNSIKTNIGQTSQGEKFVDDLIGQNLRTAAVTARLRLDPDYNKVTNEELAELAKHTGVDHITLFARSGDDIIAVRSSDPKDINISAKGWDTISVAFNQLLNLQEVNVGMGQTLPNYWSGPFDTATSDPEEVNKWGYYYDGGTNYIIDPYVYGESFRKYQEMTGVEDAIALLMRDNQHTALEISVLNSDKLLGRDIPELNPTPSHWFSEREVLFGSYEYRDPEEQKYAAMALASNGTVFYVTESKGKSVLKSFTPINAAHLKYHASGSLPLIEIASDYGEIEEALNQELRSTLMFMGICTLLALVIMAGILWLFKRNKKLAIQDVKEAYVGNIETLFQSVREQRHDFINHIQTIHAFVTLQRYDQLKKYTNTLVGEIQIIHELININDPALSALMQAKIAQAESLHIVCEYDFKHMDRLELSPIKATDVVKMFSNLIDNAFDATAELDKQHRRVKITGDVVNNQLLFKVGNAGPEIPAELKGKIFESGFSSKTGGENSGLGLHIVKQLVTRYKGTIQVTSANGYTEFSIIIPLT
ncbi:sensor histidine kinase [Paenibacillus xerothermodurans]|nr:ATP-binding protein [Paenibacillus xerothermodurans]